MVVDGPDYPYAVTSSIRVFYMPGEQGDAPEISVSEHMKLFIEGLEETAEQQGGRLHVCDDESDEDEYAGLYDDEDALNRPRFSAAPMRLEPAG